MRGLTASLVVLIVVGQGACVMDPYVKLNMKDKHSSGRVFMPDNLANTIERASKLKGNYEYKASGNQIFKNGLAATLPLLYASTSFAAANPKAGMTKYSEIVNFGSVAALTTASWLTKPTREQIYLEGAAAVGCAIDAALPFNLDSGKRANYFIRDFTEITTDEQDVNSKLATLKAALLAQVDSPSDAQVAARSAVSQAEALQAKTDALIANLKQAEAQADQAAPALWTSLISISSLVNSQIQTTTYDVADLQTRLSSVASPGQQPAAQKSPTATTVNQAPGAQQGGVKAEVAPGVAGNGGDITALTMALQNAITKLDSASIEARVFTGAVANAALNQCQTAGGLLLRVDTPTPFTVIQGGQTYVSVHVPVPLGQPTVLVNGPGQVGKTVQLATPDYQIELSGLTGDKSNSPLGDYQLVVGTSDGLQRQSIPFQVIPASGGGGDAGNGHQTPPSPPGSEPAWVTKDLAAVLDYDVSGSVPPKDYPTALKDYAAEHLIKKYSDKDGAPLDVVVATAKEALSTNPTSKFERWWASTERVKKLQSILTVKQSGIFDDPTETAISRTPPKGVGLTAGLVKKLKLDTSTIP